MPAVSAPGEVLVTGASGFLAVHVCLSLLKSGYNVRGTVRSPPKGEYLRKLFDGDYPGKFTYVIVKEITEPGAFDEAVKGVDAIAHTASPFYFAAEDSDPDDLIKPAVHGTTGILKSAKEYGTSVRRIVVTSSVSAVDFACEPPYTYTTADWNNWSIEEVKSKGRKAGSYAKYQASKTLAERALWDFISDNKGSIKFDGVTTNTPYLYGPVLQEVSSFDKLNTSTVKLWKLLADPAPKNDEELTEWVGDHLDVRDVAEAIVDAIAREDMAGHRLLMAGGPLTRQDFLDAAHALGPALPKLPFTIPVGRPGTGDSKRDQMFRFSSDESKKLLGREFRQLPEMIKGTLVSIEAKGLIKQ